MFKQVLSRLNNIPKVFFCQKGNLSSLAPNSLARTTPHMSHTSNPTAISFQSQCLLSQGCSHAPSYNLTQIRTAKFAYRPNALKRIRKHGLEKRLSSRSQREILFRKIIKQKKRLTVFDRFLNQVPEIKNKTEKRAKLFDKKKGFRQFVEKPEYFRF